MKKTVQKRPGRDPAATFAQLLDAAEREFNAHGFEGTDTNRIAKAAGYAPQTFYRHFRDKKAVFLAVYDRWWKDEVASVERSAAGRPPSGEQAARVALAFHTKWRVFRRSLRHLAIVDPEVRAARTAARRAQIARMKRLSGRPGRSDAELFAQLLTAERLCDAAAEGELADLGMSAKAARECVAAAMAALAGATP